MRLRKTPRFWEKSFRNMLSMRRNFWIKALTAGNHFIWGRSRNNVGCRSRNVSLRHSVQRYGGGACIGTGVAQPASTESSASPKHILRALEQDRSNGTFWRSWWNNQTAGARVWRFYRKASPLWMFDAVVVRYSKLINNLDSLVITKLDVLDHLPEIKICTGYRYNGKLLRSFRQKFKSLNSASRSI